jgi:carboxyl-terminal processing protease
MNKNNNKKWYVLIFIAVLIVSNIATFFFTNLITIAVGDKVIVQAKDAHTADFINKMLYLKNEIQTSYYKDVKEQDLFDGALAGMFDAVGDPYTAYYDEDQFSTYMEQLEGSYVGIGVVVTMSEDDRVTVVSPIEGSPGQKAGLASGDIITAVDGKGIEGLNLEEVVSLIKGDEGTQVEITVLKKNSEEEIDIAITREEIIMTSVSSQVYEDIGYMAITQFEPYTYEEFEKQLNELKRQSRRNDERGRRDAG